MAYVKDEHGTEWLYEPFSSLWQHELMKLPEVVRWGIHKYHGPVDIIRLRQRAHTPGQMLYLLNTRKAPIMGELR